MVEQFGGVLMQMSMLFLIVAVGYAAKKLAWMDERIDRGLSVIVLNTALPAAILASVLSAETLPSLQQLGIMAAFSVAAYALLLVGGLLLTFVLRIRPGSQGVFRFMALFGNVGFIGFPVTTALFGSESLIYASIFQIPFNLLVFTIGIWFLAQDNEKGVKVRLGPKQFLTPALASCLAAIVFIVLGIHNVPVVSDTLSTLGSMTTPASLLIIGSSLANLPVRELLGGPKLWVASFWRLLFMPILLFFLMRPFIADPTLLGVIVVLSGMPVATNGTMLCYQYHGNAKVMAQGTFITTVFSLVTIPLLMMLLTL
ncbi:MAG: AEC family transporter [Coriobacteriia bacterium]|nr:AEC family transporter [Coriobacteriia bacterium]